MKMTYEHKNELTFIGFSTTIRPDEGYTKCPEFWDKEYSQKFARLWQTMQPETALEKAILDIAVKNAPQNPKRVKRESRKQAAQSGIGTKSQQALKLLQEQNKQEHKGKSREQREAEELRRFILKQQKKREKHKGH